MGTIATMKPVSRALVEAFYHALANGDFATVASHLADDVEWTIGGPVDLLHYCGTRRGKAAVLDLLERKVPLLFDARRFIADALLVDGDRAAILGRMSDVKRDTGRSINYRISQFLRFRHGKVVEYVSVLDSFDAVEQVIGRRIDVAKDGDDARAIGDIVAL